MPLEASRLGVSHSDWIGVRDEAVRLLRRLIAVDTSNPPGNETALAVVLQEYLRGSGIEAEIHGEPPDRKNLVARVKGCRPGPRVLLLSHSDVVPAPEEDWLVPPFAGVVKDGCVWGRGALDMKNQMAAHAVALSRLVRSQQSIAGEVILAATSDEEVRTMSGARWLLEQEPELVRCDYLITESVLDGSRAGDISVFPLAVAEKSVAMFRLRARGEGGHASLALHELNAVTSLSEMLTRLEKLEPDTVISPDLRSFIEAMLPGSPLVPRLINVKTARAALRELALQDPKKARTFESLMGATFSPTILRTNSDSVNVIPTEASVDVDCRFLPSQDLDYVEAHVRKALSGFDDWSLEWLEVERSGESAKSTPLGEALQEVISRMSPGGQVLSIYSTAGTDMPWFRQALPDLVAYGFCPSFCYDSASAEARMHSSNERIDIDDLGLQVLFFEHALVELLR